MRLLKKGHRYAHITPFFKKLELLKLHDVNRVSTLVFVHKTLNNVVCSPVEFQIRRVPEYRLRNNDDNLLHVPFARQNYSTLFIGIWGPNLWITIPLNIPVARTPMSYKRNIKKFYINSY